MRNGDECPLCNSPVSRGTDRARYESQTAHLSCVLDDLDDLDDDLEDLYAPDF